MQVILNGDVCQLPSDVTKVSHLFSFLGVEERGRVVELNGDIVSPQDFFQTPLSEDDQIEIIQFMGGG